MQFLLKVIKCFMHQLLRFKCLKQFFTTTELKGKKMLFFQQIIIFQAHKKQIGRGPSLRMSKGKEQKDNFVPISFSQKLVVLLKMLLFSNFRPDDSCL